MGRHIALLVGFVLLVVALGWGLKLDPTKVQSPLIGKPAPEFVLPDLADPDAQVSSKDYEGRVALVNVWATWCSGCFQEHPTLLRIANSGVVPIYGLNWKDGRAKAQSWLARYGDPYTATAFDADGRVAIDWGVYGAPETFLVGADGTVLYKHVSPLTDAIWETEFLPRIEQAGGSKE